MLRSTVVFFMVLLALSGCGSSKPEGKSLKASFAKSSELFDLFGNMDDNAMLLRIVNKSDKPLVFSASALGLEAVATLADGESIWLSKNPRNMDAAIPLDALCIVPTSSSLEWSIEIDGKVPIGKKISSVRIRILPITEGMLNERVQPAFKDANLRLRIIEADVHLQIK